MKKERSTISKIGFLLSVIGSTVGLGGIWGFPTAMYQHKGTFLLPFIICMVICAIPILALEMTIGNKTRKNHIEFFSEKMGKKGALFAWLHSTTVIILSTYYSVLIGWTLINIFISSTNYINKKSYFYDHILNNPSNNVTGFGSLGSFNWIIVVATIIVWILLFVILFGGVAKGIDKANKIFIPALFVIVIVLVIYTATLPGAANGMNNMFKFDPKGLISPKLWKDAFGQAFFMLSTCTGTIYIYAAHAPKKQDNSNHAYIVGFGTSIVGVLTAMIVFNAIGHIAAVNHQKFEEVFGQGGPTLIFQVLPQLFSNINQLLFGFGNFIGVIFFLALFFAGISSLIGQVESLVNGLEYQLQIKRVHALIFSACFAFLFSLIFTFNNSSPLITAVGSWVSQLWLLIIGFILLIIIGPLGKNLYSSLKQHNNQVSWIKWNRPITLFLLIFAPLMVLINIIAAFYDLIVDLQTNIFINGFFGLIIGFGVPFVLALILTFYQSITKFLINKKVLQCQ